jgi:hypothetical protein
VRTTDPLSGQNSQPVAQSIQCEDGQVATGGGAIAQAATGSGDVALAESYPVGLDDEPSLDGGQPTGWFAKAIPVAEPGQVTNTTAQIQVYVLCAPGPVQVG